jgi:hypothetical protein
MWAVMEHFGQVLSVNQLNGADIHCMENVMTMEQGLHELFDSLGIWFKARVCCVAWIFEVDG